MTLIDSRVAAGRRESADGRRSIPSVEQVLQALPPTPLPRALVVATVRAMLGEVRATHAETDFETVVGEISAALRRLARTRLRPVINGTGVLLHTNLGRAPLAPEAVAAVAAAAGHYTNLEFDVEAGERGGRAAYVERALALACGAEAATVVNNCAAALVLVLRHCTATRPEVLVSRGELIQIGGGFRIPDILAASGARLCEVGTTNQTSLDDYAGRIGPETGLILKVHRSNFRMEGFVASPSTAALASLAQDRDVPFVEDLGSGAIEPIEAPHFEPREPTAAEILSAGADLVTFSGDKLFGGPQAGIIVGRGAMVAALKHEPLFRALRCDKLVFAALEATVEAWLSGRAAEQLPVHAMMRTPVAVLRERAERLQAALRSSGVPVRVVECSATVGGGSMPTAEIPSIGVELSAAPVPAAELRRRLLQHSPPVAGVVVRDGVRIDLRTVFPAQDETVADAFRAAFDAGSAAARGGGAAG